MLKFIHNDFEINLQNIGVNEQEESNFFSDKFFTKFTMPFDFDIPDELNKKLNNLLSDNVNNPVTYFEGYYYHFGVLEAAVFEIEGIDGRKGSGTMQYGVEDLPNADKKLSELPLDNFKLTGTVYDHAKNIVPKTWPEVTHNFPAVFQTRLAETDEKWKYFEGVVNNYTNGNFIENSYDSVEDRQLNKNMMQPMPYLMHVLEKGFLDAGFVMKGSFPEDPEFKKALLVIFSEYYAISNADAFLLEVRSNEYDSLREDYYGDPIEETGNFVETISLPEPGRYKIAGNIHLRVDNHTRWDRERFDYYPTMKSSAWLSYAGTMLWSNGLDARLYKEQIFSVDVTIDYDGTGPLPSLEMDNLTYGREEGQIVQDALVVDLTVTQLAIYDVNGDLSPTLNDVSDINLKKSVPDMTFGKLVTTMKNWRNLSVTPIGNEIHLNYLQKTFTTSEIIDIHKKCPPDKNKTFHTGDSYLLQFENVNSIKYNFEKIYIDKDGYTIDKDASEQTNEITIKGIPLPITSLQGRTTADLFDENQNRVNLVLFGGLKDNKNDAENPANLLLERTYLDHYKIWFEFRLSSVGFEFLVEMFEIELQKINIKNRLYAYNRLHVIKSLNKKQVHDDLWEVEIKTESY